MGEHQKDLGWRPPVIFALIAVAVLAIVWLWPDWSAVCPEAAERTKLLSCAREWAGAGSSWLAVIVALISLIVLWRTLLQMRRSSEQQLRAYIYCNGVEIVGLPGSPVVRVFLKNYGSTPAFRVVVRRQIFIREPDFEGQSAVEVFEEHLGDFGPTEERTSEYVCDPQMYPRLMEGSPDKPTNWLYVILVITYTSAFSNEHQTALRFQSVRGKWIANGPLAISHKGVWST